MPFGIGPPSGPATSMVIEANLESWLWADSSVGVVALVVPTGETSTVSTENSACSDATWKSCPFLSSSEKTVHEI